jgi:trk system potassium uptake protein TrkH
MNWKVVIRTIGLLIILEAILMAFCIIPAVVYSEDLHGILLSVGVTLTIGLGMSFSFREAPQNIGRHEGYFIVGTVWLIFSIIGAIPFLFTHCLSSFADGFFEAMSGFTTTGATIIPDVEILPKHILLWRGQMQWIGGMGIIVLTVAIIPMIGTGGTQLYNAEVTGPTKDKIHPHIKDTASRLYLTYIACTILEVVLLMVGGMKFLDALVLAQCTISSGGFWNYNDGLASASPYAQYVVIFFMFISGVNFVLLYMGARGKFRYLTQDEELKTYILLIVIFTLSIFGINIWEHFSTCQSFADAEQQLRNILFLVVSFITTTGFSSCDYGIMPFATKMLFFILTFIGACAGSTSGAIKVVRINILIKNSYLALKQILHPNGVLTLRLSKKPLGTKVISNVYAFVVMYIAIFLLGSFLLSIMGHDFYTSCSAVALSIGNGGMGFTPEGMISCFASFPDFSKYVMALSMYIGRLEIFTVLILFLPEFWKK